MTPENRNVDVVSSGELCSRRFSTAQFDYSACFRCIPQLLVICKFFHFHTCQSVFRGHPTGSLNMQTRLSLPETIPQFDHIPQPNRVFQGTFIVGTFFRWSNPFQMLYEVPCISHAIQVFLGYFPSRKVVPDTSSSSKTSSTQVAVLQESLHQSAIGAISRLVPCLSNDPPIHPANLSLFALLCYFRSDSPVVPPLNYCVHSTVCHVTRSDSKHDRSADATNEESILKFPRFLNNKSSVLLFWSFRFISACRICLVALDRFTYF